MTCSEPVLVPKSSFLTAPAGALKHTFTGLPTGWSHFVAGLSVLPVSLLLICVCVSPVTLLCVDVCEDIIVAGAEDGSIMVWTMSSCRLLHILLKHTGGPATGPSIPMGSLFRVQIMVKGQLSTLKLTCDQTSRVVVGLFHNRLTGC